MRSVGNEKLALDARITARTAGQLTISDLVFRPRNETGISVSFNSNGNEVVALRYCTDGGIRGIVSEAEVGQSPDHIYLIDQRPDFHGVTSGMRQLSIYFPYQLIGYDPSRQPAARALQTSTPVGRMLKSLITSAAASLSDATAAEADIVSAGLADAIRGLLYAEQDSERSRRDFETARMEAMRSFILKNIANPDLGVTDVCAAFGASRATTFRVFKSAGGIQRYIMHRRLEHAYGLLSESPETRGQITRVAQQCGFRDTSLFSRSFRARFGLPPGDVLGQHPSGQSEAGGMMAVGGQLPEEHLFFRRLFS